MSVSVYIDANVLIAAFEMSNSVSDSVWRVLDAINDGVISAVTSELTLAELLPKPLASEDGSLVDLYEALICLGGALDIAPVTRDVLIGSAKIRAQIPRIKLPDAIHLATALQRRCPAFLTSDIRIGAPSGLQIIRPTKTSLDEIMELTA